jgi:uncharacterized protein (DUF58 family)
VSIVAIIFVAITLAGLQSYIFYRYGLRRIEYERYFDRRSVYEGEYIEMVERIENRKLLPVPWVRLESMLHASLVFDKQGGIEISSGSMFQNHASWFSMNPYTKIVRRHRILCARRGWHRLQSAVMTGGDLFGFQRPSRKLSVDAELLVFPKPVPLSEIPLPSHSWQGDYIVRRWMVEDPFTISGVRDYQNGDSLRSVNWKATARAGRLQVHRRECTADHRLLICVNVEVSEKMWQAVTDPELIERGIAYAASIAQHAILQGIETGFGCNGYTADRPKQSVRITPISGRHQLITILETMAKLEIARSIPFDTFLEEEIRYNTTNTDLLLITPFVSEKMERQMRQLRQRGNAVEVFTLQPEQEHRETTEAAKVGLG